MNELGLWGLDCITVWGLQGTASTYLQHWRWKWPYSKTVLDGSTPERFFLYCIFIRASQALPLLQAGRGVTYCYFRPISAAAVASILLVGQEEEANVWAKRKKQKGRGGGERLIPGLKGRRTWQWPWCHPYEKEQNTSVVTADDGGSDDMMAVTSYKIYCVMENQCFAESSFLWCLVWGPLMTCYLNKSGKRWLYTVELVLK